VLAAQWAAAQTDGQSRSIQRSIAHETLDRYCQCCWPEVVQAYLAAAFIRQEFAPGLSAPHAHNVACVCCLVLPPHWYEIITTTTQ
jgi:hypothetical protein